MELTGAREAVPRDRAWGLISVTLLDVRGVTTWPTTTGCHAPSLFDENGSFKKK